MSVVPFDLPVPDLSAWRAGNTGVEGVWQFDAGVPGRHVLITALVHGNELCGAWALAGLLAAGIRPRQGRLTLAFCHLAAFDRFDPAAHDAARFVEQDMNRQWSPDRLAAGDTLERRRARDLAPFAASADWLLDLHSMHEPAPPLALAGLQGRHLALAQAMRSPSHVVIDAGHQDGVRLRDFGRFGQADADSDACALLVECGFHGDPASRAVAQDQCVRFLRLSGVVGEDDLAARLPGWLQPDAPQQWALTVDGAVVARGTDVRFVEPFQGLEVIPIAGTLVGWNAGEPVLTPYDDCVLVMPSVRQARAGVTVVRFARRTPL